MIDAQLERECQHVAKRIERLTLVIETGGDLSAPVSKLRRLEARGSAIDGDTSPQRIGWTQTIGVCWSEC